MTKKIILIVTLILMFGLMIVWTIPVNASSQHPQAYYQTPTPDATGRIIYRVQKNDSCVSIYLLTNVEVDTIRQLNKLDENCTIQEGQELLLGVFEQPTAAPTLPPTPGPALPTATASKGMGRLCIYLFFDANGNAMPEENEPPIENGAFSIQDKENIVALSDKSGIKPVCKDVPEADYNISVAPPEGFNPTMSMNYAIRVNAGETLVIPFGAQPSAISNPTSQPANANPSGNDGSGNGFWLLLAGLFLILAGLGLGVYFIFISRKNQVL